MVAKKDDVEKYIIEFLKNEFQVDKRLHSLVRIQEVLDSLDIMNLLFAIEEKYQIKIPDEKLEDPEMLVIENMAMYIVDRL